MLAGSEGAPPTLQGVAKTAARAQTAVDQSVLACALERYRLAIGKFPANLAALTPAYIARIPPDHISGQPLKYRLEADGRFVFVQRLDDDLAGGLAAAEQLRRVATEGGAVLFLPPVTRAAPVASNTLPDLAWGVVQAADHDQPFRVTFWEEQEGPLEHTADGRSLPVAQLAIAGLRSRSAGRRSRRARHDRLLR